MLIPSTPTHARPMHTTALHAVHDCPECGESCDCDGEDLHHDEAPYDCTHACEVDEEDPMWNLDDDLEGE